MSSWVVIALLIVGGIGGALYYYYTRSQAPTDEQLKRWLAFLENGGTLEEHEYDAVDRLFPPGLKARYLKAMRRTQNQHAARAITVELILRTQAANKPLTERQIEILQREGLRGSRAEARTPVPPGETEFDDET